MDFICPHNQHVLCIEEKCSRCGWNPEVAERRLKKIKEDLGITEKEGKDELD